MFGSALAALCLSLLAGPLPRRCRGDTHAAPATAASDDRAACQSSVSVEQLEVGAIPLRQGREHWTYFEAPFYLPPGTLGRWQEDAETYDLLSSVLQKGYIDFSDAVCGEYRTCMEYWKIPREVQRALRIVVEIVGSDPDIGELYGNARAWESSALTHLFGPGSRRPEEEDKESWPALRPEAARTLKQVLELMERDDEDEDSFQRFGACNEAAHAEARRAAGAARLPLEAPACLVCREFGVFCRISEDGASSELLALRIELLPRLATPPKKVRPCDTMRVLLLDIEGNPPSFLRWFSEAFPNVRYLNVVGKFEPELRHAGIEHLALGAWTAGVQALLVEDESGQLPCAFPAVRVLHFDPPVTAFHPCLGSLQELTELRAINVGLRGVAAVPPELRGLKQLRSFHAFSQGGQSNEEANCTPPLPADWQPPADFPGPVQCVPGYVYAIGHHEEPTWRCPWIGWVVRMDDEQAPWWGWERLERFHVDANFFYGPIPDFLPSRWPRLRSLDLHDNRLSGALPSSLLRLKNLTQLQVQLNDLDCPAPEAPSADGSDSAGPLPRKEQDVVAGLFAHPRMRTLNLDQNPRLCGCAPPTSRMEAQVGGTRIRIDEDRSGCGGRSTGGGGRRRRRLGRRRRGGPEDDEL